MLARHGVGRPRAVLVVGAGFIGSHVARGFVLRGIPTMVLTRTQPIGSTAALIAGARVVVADVRDPVVFDRSLEDVDRVVWCAGGLPPYDSNMRPIEDVGSSLLPLLSALRCIASRGDVETIFLSSGGTVYGSPSVLPVPEHHHTQPITSHGISKLAAEHYLGLYSELYGVRGLILRCANVYGPGQPSDRSQGLVATVLARAARNEPVVVFGDGTAVRDFVHVDDVVHVICTLAGRPSGPRVVNVGTGVGTSVDQLLDTVRSVTGRPIAAEYAPARRGDVHQIVLNIELLRSLLAFDPLPLAEGVERTLIAETEAAQLAR